MRVSEKPVGGVTGLCSTGYAGAPHSAGGCPWHCVNVLRQNLENDMKKIVELTPVGDEVSDQLLKAGCKPGS